MPKTTPEHAIQRALKYIHLVPDTPITSANLLKKIGITGGAGAATLRTMLIFGLTFRVMSKHYARTPLADRILKNDVAALKEAVLTPPLFATLYRQKMEGKYQSTYSIVTQLQSVGWTRFKAERAAISYLRSLLLLPNTVSAPIALPALSEEPVHRTFSNEDNSIQITVPYDFTKNDLKREIIKLVNSIEPW